MKTDNDIVVKYRCEIHSSMADH